jgi:2,4-dienoyl-CoA reductase-like NADH-dependent reductase (Old Yellow Enzyme family)
MTRYFSPDGVPGEGVAGYYRRRAEGGVGLIITEGVGVDHPVAVDHPGIPHLHGERSLAQWKAVVDEVHAAGAKIFPQLWHQGVMWQVEHRGKAGRGEAVRPSGVWGPPDGVISIDPQARDASTAPTRAMTEEEIADVISAFARSAANARALGFDGVAIHGAHGYLIDTFLWDYTNRRQDDWGGDRRARARFGAEIVKAIRREIGEDMPIVLRFSQFKMQDYRARLAQTPDELGELLEPLAEAGVDLFDGSQRFFDTPIFDGSPLNLAGWAKTLTGKASMTVGGVGLGAGGKPVHINLQSESHNNLPLALARMQRGEFDLLGVGRALLNDPRWLEKAKAGEPFSPFDPANLDRLA